MKGADELFDSDGSIGYASVGMYGFGVGMGGDGEETRRDMGSSMDRGYDVARRDMGSSMDGGGDVRDSGYVMAARKEMGSSMDRGYVAVPSSGETDEVLSSSTDRGYFAVASAPPRRQVVKQLLERSKGHPILRHFSGHSYRFAREFANLFPDRTRVQWSDVLQWTLSLPQNTEFALREKSLIFATVMEEFVETARPFAKLLIDESFLPEEERTVRPDPRFGGVAGGRKYRVHAEATQLFKFAEDVCHAGQWLYGGQARNDRLAMKSAGHEIKSAQAIIDAGVAELNVPLMAVFTLRGKRVMCASLLPVRGKDTLVQGKDNVMDRIRTPPPHIEAVMAELGAKLFIGKSRKPRGQEIYGPFDMEIHHSHEDGKLYMIDAARLMPPEYRGGTTTGCEQFYQLYRPELLRLAARPVISDAIQHRDKAGARDLVQLGTIMDFAMEEVRATLEEGAVGVSTRQELKELLHRHGINMRHLKSLVDGIQDEEIRRHIVHVASQERVEVKTLKFPRGLTSDELTRVLALQEESLKEPGPLKMQLVPTLLQLASLWTPDDPPLERVHAFRFVNAFQPGGRHPLARAFDLCVAFDPEFRFDAVTLEIQRCSSLSLRVIFELLLLDPSFTFPSLQSFCHLVETHPPSIFTDRMKRWSVYAGEDLVDVTMLHAGRDGAWDVVEALATQYGKSSERACVVAELGSLDMVRRQAVMILDVNVKEAMLHAAARGGQVDVVEFLVCEAGVNVDATQSEHWTPLIVAASSGRAQVVNALLKHKAMVDARTAHGFTGKPFFFFLELWVS